MCLFSVILAILFCSFAQAQHTYEVIQVKNGGTISGAVKWSGAQPRSLTFPITKDPQICDPESRKRIDLERLIIGPDGGVANTVVFLKGMSQGKPMVLPEARRFLDQRRCRYEPHVLLVPQAENLKMKSSDATLHTIHMEGAATYNLPFPFPNQVVSRTMQTPGLVTLKCNGGHVWMNAVAVVTEHPYYVVTDETGRFELTNVPAGHYELVAWHEGWTVTRNEATHDVLTEHTVQRPLFSPPRTWQKAVTVEPNQSLQVQFVISER